MAGKPNVLADRSLHYAIDKCSKNTLIDLVWDLAVKQLGDDEATDEAIANLITEWLDPVMTMRGDRRIKLWDHVVALRKRDAENWLEKQRIDRENEKWRKKRQTEEK